MCFHNKEGESVLRNSFPSTVTANISNTALTESTLGLSDIVSYQKGQGFDWAKSFKEAGKIGKGVAVLNTALSVADVFVVGTNETHHLARNKGIEVGSIDYVQAQAGGVAIDMVKNVSVGAVSTALGTGIGVVAASGFALLSGFMLPAAGVTGITIISGILISYGLNKLDDKFKISESIKDWWTGVVKD